MSQGKKFIKYFELEKNIFKEKMRAVQLCHLKGIESNIFIFFKAVDTNISQI